MYKSITKIDIVCKNPKGGEVYIQTDHRTPEEITQEEQMSALLAILRILSPRLYAHLNSIPCEVQYHLDLLPPLSLQRAIAAAGGTLHVGPPGETTEIILEPTPLVPFMNQTFADLAKRVCAEQKIACDVNGLEQLEALFFTQTGAPLAYDKDFYDGGWEALLSLAAVAGEILRNPAKGQWESAENFNFSTFPLMFSVQFGENDASLNLLGKAQKFLTNGEGDAVSALVKMGLVRSAQKR